MIKAVILIGGPLKGTRFRPLSFQDPKPLFPVAGIPMIQHLIESCAKVPDMKEIFLIGFYQLNDLLSRFINNMMRDYSITIRYLQEYSSLGTAGGVYHFRDQIRVGSPEAFFLINGDVCGEFPFEEMLQFHRQLPEKRTVTVMSTEATRQQSLNYGCIVENADTHEVLHYVEKPETFVSNIINCGVYLCSLNILYFLSNIFKSKNQEFADAMNRGDLNYINDGNSVNIGRQYEYISWEEEVLRVLANSGELFVFNTTNWWSQIKTAGSAIYANRLYLELYRQTHSNWLAKDSDLGPKIIGDVFIHPSASVDRTAIIGPNVSISQGVNIGAGVRIRDSIILQNATINDHTLVLNAIIGWNCIVGSWSRVEGTPCDPNPNKPFAKMENKPLFDGEGRLNPPITVLGSDVQVSSETIVLNSIVLPHKELDRSYKNEIVL